MTKNVGNSHSYLLKNYPVRKIQNNKNIFDFSAPFYAEFTCSQNKRVCVNFKKFMLFSTLFSNKY